MEEIYLSTARSIEELRQRYFYETKLGADLGKLERYNATVLRELGIDNIKLLGPQMEVIIDE